jgi:hypothetical protein
MKPMLSFPECSADNTPSLGIVDSRRGDTQSRRLLAHNFRPGSVSSTREAQRRINLHQREPRTGIIDPQRGAVERSRSLQTTPRLLTRTLGIQPWFPHWTKSSWATWIESGGRWGGREDERGSERDEHDLNSKPIPFFLLGGGACFQDTRWETNGRGEGALCKTTECPSRK